MKKWNKIKQNRVMTAIEGSYPKPSFLFPGSGRELLDDFGVTFHEFEQKIGTLEFKRRQDKAALMAIRDQNAAGIDFVSDGEERRGHYVLHVLKKLNGIDFSNFRQKSIRGGVYVRWLPAVIDKIAYKENILVDDYRFTCKYTNNTVKINIPGPSTVVDCLVDQYYCGNCEKMAMDYSLAIRQEIEMLIDAGCKMIQFDDPVLIRYIDQTRNWGLDALQNCFKGFEDKATFIVHICCGYPDKRLEKKGVRYKADQNFYRDIFKWFSKSTIDIVSIEGAQNNLDLSILSLIGNKGIMLGIVDVGSNTVESVESILMRGKEALKFLSKKQLVLAPDCGMLQLSRHIAKRKLCNISIAASILNQHCPVKDLLL